MCVCEVHDHFFVFTMKITVSSCKGDPIELHDKPPKSCRLLVIENKEKQQHLLREDTGLLVTENGMETRDGLS